MLQTPKSNSNYDSSTIANQQPMAASLTPILLFNPPTLCQPWQMRQKTLFFLFSLIFLGKQQMGASPTLVLLCIPPTLCQPRRPMRQKKFSLFSLILLGAFRVFILATQKN